MFYLNKKWFSLAFLILIGLFAYFLYGHKNISVKNSPPVLVKRPIDETILESNGFGSKTKLLENNCFSIEKNYIRGVSMEPLLKNNQAVLGYMGYYHCHNPQIGDLVILRFRSQPDKYFVKKLVALEGDKIEFNREYLLINGKIAKNSQGQNYLFSEQSQKRLSIPLENKKIPHGYYLVLGETVGPEAYDSRSFGYIEDEHLVGKIAP